MSDARNGERAGSLLFLHAQTSLHPGSGTALGVVDLPVQRERHTQWPTIPGSALKGVLRDACRESKRRQSGESRRKINEEDAEIVAAFGPGTPDESSAHAGALSVTDARILAFPVRSARSVFAWVTCPAVLERLSRDLQLIGQMVSWRIPKQVGDQKAACVEGSPLLFEGGQLLLEEFDFNRVEEPVADVAEWISRSAAGDEASQERLCNHLVVLSDDDFTHFVKHATEVVARIALDYERKTVKKGALFYQEFLPAESLFYSIVLASASRRQDDGRHADEVLGVVKRTLAERRILQIGGDESTGKGLCIARLSGERGN